MFGVGTSPPKQLGWAKPMSSNTITMTLVRPLKRRCSGHEGVDV